MSKNLAILLISLALITITGCVERKLTINTQPQGALVTLNDEEIGTSPVTTSFLWYGDYYVKITKDGYETLKTVKDMDRPLHDVFPFDFFAQILYPKTIEDDHTWNFELEPYQRPTRAELLDSAESMRQQALFELE